ncbi:hypothetical protein FSP39_006563 [Pinctada imbricata]|uniref:Beta-1,4-galactosyltransferase n=1 Tax=Pinctada imbricata TaxID=66713 RepID=A0AA89BT55_PINIB|nr:hypothetical protein FSP39_006563 [Pinctada imbricata]
MRRTKCLALGICCSLIITFLIALYPLQQDGKPCSCDKALQLCGADLQQLCASFHSNKSTHSEEVRSQKDVYEDNTDWGPHKMAILVPFRDRLEELLTFVPYMHEFLNKQRTRHEFYIINQADYFRFNRASLINIGFIESRSDCDYIAMHDVDLIPVNPNITYPYPESGPFHVASPELHPLWHYPKFVGGILLLTRDDFTQVNGMSNKYWGWGREDDEFYVRMKMAGLKIHRPKNITTGYKTFRHIHDKRKRPRDQARIFDQKIKTSKLDRVTGVTTVKYTLDRRSVLSIDGIKVHMLNVLLECDLTQTPWCLTPMMAKEYKEKGLL